VQEQKNVLFICIDCLRSDFAFGDYGSNKDFFDFFEREGTAFDTVISAASVTSPCVGSYMTGRYPYEHGIRSLRDISLNQDVSTLAELFKQSGYTTSAHVCGPIVRDTGLDRGFSTYFHRKKEQTVYTDWYDEFKSEISDQKSPWFTYLHLWEVHGGKRDLPPDADQDNLEYDEAIRGVMTKLEDLFELVDVENTIIAITGDHGESIYDGTLRNFLTKNILEYFHIPLTNKTTGDLRSSFYDKYLQKSEIDLEDFYNSLRKYRKRDFPSALHKVGHGYHVYDFITRVPFAIAGHNVPNNGRITTQVRQVDIFPTLLHAADISSPDVEGQNLLSGDIDIRPAFSSACGPTLRSEKNWLYSVRYNNRKLIRGTERSLRQLFNLEKDPGEINNISGEQLEKEDPLEELLDGYIQSMKRRQNDTSNIDPDKMEKQLEDLGYL